MKEKIEIPTSNDSIFEKSNIVYFSPLNPENPNSRDLEILKEKFNIIEIDFNQFEVNNVVHFPHKNKNLFLCIYKTNYFDKFSYSEFFTTLLLLKNTLKLKQITEINLSMLNSEYDNVDVPRLSELLHFLFKNSRLAITLCLNTLVHVPPEQVQTILEENHNTAIAGHPGFVKMYQRLREKYTWPNMKQDVQNYVKSCTSCQINKTDRHPSKNPMQITTTSSRPFEKISIDIVGPLNITETGNQFIFTLIDDLTKFFYAVPIPNHEALTIANELNKFISLFGIPEVIVSDQGTEFTSNIIKDLTKLFKIHHVLASPYHPQSNASLERTHATLKDYLKHFISKNPDSWDEYVTHAILYFNTTIHSSTKFSPYELVFGHKAHIPSSITQNPEFKYTYETYFDQLKLKLNSLHDSARQTLIYNKEKSKLHYDKSLHVKNLQVGDLVLVQNKQTQVGISKKLLPRYHGPYPIIKIFPNNTAQIKIRRKHITYHIDMLKLFVPDGN